MIDATPAPKWADPDVTSVGLHNSKLAESTLRILEGGSWKKQDIVVVMPAAKMVPMKCALSWMNLIYPPNQAVQKIAALGMEVGDAYSECIKQIVEHPQLRDYRYILTIEHDQVVPADGVLRLLRRMEEHPEFGCVSGLYWTKFEGGVPQIWGDAKDPQVNFRPQPPDPHGGLVECCGTGMGFALWRMEMLADPRLPKPLFKTQAGPEGVGTQDLAAWSELRKFGYRCAVDCSCLVGHMDPRTDTVW